MNNLKALRETYKLNLYELSRLTRISYHKLRQVEQGHTVLDAQERKKLAHFFGIPEEILHPNPPEDPRICSVRKLFLVALRRRTLLALLLVILMAMGLMHPLLSHSTSAVDSPASEEPQAAPAPAAPTTSNTDDTDTDTDTVAIASGRTASEPLPTAHIARRPADEPATIAIADVPLAAYRQTSGSAATATTALQEDDRAAIPTVAPHVLLRATEEPTPQPSPTPQPVPPYTLTQPFHVVYSGEGPQACPLQPASGHVVMTQGYGVGSHIPANVLGAVDLAVDAGGDGYAEATSSWNVPIVATHDGIANVWLGSELGGNQVSVSDYHRGWRTNYAHMSVVLVESGQYVTAGSVIGLVGDSGKSTGPHLDYQVWIGGVNVNPTSLVAPCWSIE